MKTFLIVILLIAILFTAPWQAFQHNWVVQPYSTLNIHWHNCIRGDGWTVFGITWDRMLKGYKIQNAANYPIWVVACDKP